MINKVKVVEDGAIHGWFELSYAKYLVLQRTLLQSMPLEWQDKFVELLEDMHKAFSGIPELRKMSYEVNVKDEDGRFISDPFRDYERGRRRTPIAQSIQDKYS